MPDPKEIQRRLKLIGQGLREQKLDAYFVFDRANTYYATGFHCTSSYLLITRDSSQFLTDFRYIEAARQSITTSEVILHKQSPLEDITQIMKKLHIRRLGVERNLPYGMALEYAAKLAPVELVADDAPVAKARIRKSKGELDSIREAVRRADAAYIDLTHDVEEGWTELQVRNRLRRLLERHGGEKESFDSIIATGANASRPHAVPGEAALQLGDIVQIDTGLIYHHYCSDLSRVMCVGRASQKLSAIHRIVVDAQRRAIEAIRPGVKASEVDARARDYITRKGYGKNFGHGLGHGVGLEIHEPPTLRATSTDVLEEGMVVTVEPGIYIPGFGGIRIEDMGVVTKDGFEDMTTSPREIIVI